VILSCTKDPSFLVCNAFLIQLTVFLPLLSVILQRQLFSDTYHLNLHFFHFLLSSIISVVSYTNNFKNVSCTFIQLPHLHIIVSINNDVCVCVCVLISFSE